jgi:hypothetical protein
MAGAAQTKSDDSKVMLGFIVRRCAAELGHPPTPVEFATWANGTGHNGRQFCLFGKEISPVIAKIMLGQPSRLVTVSPEGLERIWKRSAR